jgi:acetylornithine deacetylase/succinyl-diaminopimelate desuccinylase-like protein
VTTAGFGALGQDSEVVDLCRALIQLDTTNPPGGETAAAMLLRDFLEPSGVECEIVARDPQRANLVARLPGTGTGPSMALVGHTDVVPCDALDWTHPPFAAVVDDDGYLFGRGAVDMKNEVAARAVTLARLGRSGFRPSGDLWFLAVADEEDGVADVGMRWLLEQRPDIRPDYALNEGEGVRLELADGRVVVPMAVGDRGTFPVRVVALGEAGHASMPSQGDNAVPLLAEILRRVGTGMPPVQSNEYVDRILGVLVGEFNGDYAGAVAAAADLHPALTHLIPALTGITMAPTMLQGSSKRNVMPARASVELDCRILPGTTEAEVEAVVRQVIGSDVRYELEMPEQLVAGSASRAGGRLYDICQEFLDETDPGAVLLPTIDTGFTDSVYLRADVGTVAYGFSPFRTTPAEAVQAGYHNRDERVHVDDLALSVQFHEFAVRRLLGPQADAGEGGIS